jgi:hypothetical protein
MKLRNGAVLAGLVVPVRVGLPVLRIMETRAGRCSSHKDGFLRFAAERRGRATCSATASARGSHSAVVAVSVSQQPAGLPITSQLTGNMVLLLPARSAGEQPTQFSSPSKSHRRLRLLRTTTPTAAGRNLSPPSSPSPELAVSTEH